MKHLSDRGLRIWKTFNLYFSAAASGMSLAVTGPTLIDLQNLVKTDTKHIAYVYTGRSSGYLLGSLIGGVIFDMTPRKPLLMTLCNFFICVSMFAITWSQRIEVLTAWMLLNGISLGAVDTGLNVCCLNLWGKDGGPFFQALHFAYGFGGLIAPLIVAPFLGDYHPTEHTLLNSSDYFHSSDNYLSNLSLPTNFEQNLEEKSLTIPRIFYGYAIIAIIALIVTVLFTIVCTIDPLDKDGKKGQAEEVKKRNTYFVAAVVLLNFVLLFVETGVEIGYAQMVTTYAVKGSLKLTPAVGSYITSTFWAAFTVARFSAIFLAFKFSNVTLILFNLIVFSSGAAVLQFLATTKEWSLWLSSVLLGAGIGPFFPTVVAWIEQYITVTNKIVSLFTVGAAFGEMLLPYIISNFIEEIPEVLSYVVSASTILSAVLSLVLYLLLRNRKEKYVEQKGVSNPAFDADGAT